MLRAELTQMSWPILKVLKKINVSLNMGRDVRRRMEECSDQV